MSDKSNSPAPIDAPENEVVFVISRPVIEGSPEHRQAIAEGRKVLVLRPDEPTPENPIL